MDEEREAPLEQLEAMEEPEDEDLIVARSSAGNSTGTGT
jgi:hypothetical protein